MKIYNKVYNYGTITVSNDIILMPGIQESGHAGLFSYAPSQGYCGYYHKFRNVMSNIPSSVTLSQDFAYNVRSVAATSVSKQGFLLEIYTSSGGTTRWRGTYTTVGN
jgi:hypothetical protein